mmetsp:Transcript_10872/g.20696  ORF Transcript_10872/g.20696 Transcript_10872/m.20696 type:complete len:262 (+) Transcript_10872:92-877(+)
MFSSVREGRKQVGDVIAQARAEVRDAVDKMKAQAFGAGVGLGAVHHHVTLLAGAVVCPPEHFPLPLHEQRPVPHRHELRMLVPEHPAPPTVVERLHVSGRIIQRQGIRRPRQLVLQLADVLEHGRVLAGVVYNPLGGLHARHQVPLVHPLVVLYAGRGNKRPAVSRAAHVAHLRNSMQQARDGEYGRLQVGGVRAGEGAGAVSAGEKHKLPLRFVLQAAVCALATVLVAAGEPRLMHSETVVLMPVHLSAMPQIETLRSGF